MRVMQHKHRSCRSSSFQPPCHNPLEVRDSLRPPRTASEDRHREPTMDRGYARTQRATDRVLNPPERVSKIVRDRGSGSSASASP